MYRAVVNNFNSGELALNLLLNNILENYKNYFKIGEGINNYIFNEEKIPFCLSNRNDPFFNVIFGESILEVDLYKTYLINTLYKFLSTKKPFRIKCTSDLNLEEIICKYNLDYSAYKIVPECNKIFYIDLNSFSKETNNHKIKSLIVKNDNTFNDWWFPFQNSFCVNLKLKQFVKEFNFEAKLKHKGRFWNFVGYFEEFPVICATVFMSNGIPCLFDFATHENYRRRGFGRDFFRQILDFLFKLNYDSIGLISTLNGETFYKKLGLRELGEIRILNFDVINKF